MASDSRSQEVRSIGFDQTAELRVDYNIGTLEKQHLNPDPIAQWQSWFDQAEQAGLQEANAMTVATVDPNGWPQARILLAKKVDEHGFVFFTNYESAKAAEIDTSQKAALLFYWQPLHRQVRITGTIQKISAAESGQYFASRPRDSQIGAWASPQSDLLSNRAELHDAVKAVEQRFEGVEEIPRPSFWGGYRVGPMLFEFWQGRSNRLHDRFRYRYADHAWQIERLAP